MNTAVGTPPKILSPKLYSSLKPEEIVWSPFPAFPPEARLAVLVGDPREPGPYVIRVRLPGGARLMPHVHQEDRIYTVLSGTFYIGRGDRYDADRLTAHEPGSVVVLPGGTHHFHWAKSGEYVTQVYGVGPLSIDYLEAKDDPRHASGQ